MTVIKIVVNFYTNQIISHATIPFSVKISLMNFNINFGKTVCFLVVLIESWGNLQSMVRLLSLIKIVSWNWKYVCVGMYIYTTTIQSQRYINSHTDTVYSNSGFELFNCACIRIIIHYIYTDNYIVF